MADWGLSREDKETILFVLGLILVLVGAVTGADHWPGWLQSLIPMLLVGTVVAKSRP